MSEEETNEIIPAETGPEKRANRKGTYHSAFCVSCGTKSISLRLKGGATVLIVAHGQKNQRMVRQ